MQTIIAYGTISAWAGVIGIAGGELLAPLLGYKRVGAMRFFRIGRFGGSFYLKKKPQQP